VIVFVLSTPGAAFGSGSELMTYTLVHLSTDRRGKAIPARLPV